MGQESLQKGLAGRSHKPGAATNVATPSATATPGKRTLVDTAHAGAPGDRRPSEALHHLRVAEIGLDTLCAMTDLLVDKARSADPEPVVAMARTIVPIHEPVLGALKAAFLTVREYDHEVADETERPIATVAAETLRVPGMRQTVERVTQKLARYMATMDDIRAKHTQLDPVLSSSRYGSMHVMLNRVRGNFDLAPQPRDLTIVSTTRVVDLGNGGPRDKIQDAVYSVASAWNQRVTNFALAVGEFVHLIQHAELEKADSKLMGKLWSVAKKLLADGATFLTGTPLGATLGIAAIEKLHAYERALEQARERKDEAAFIRELQQRVTELQQTGIAPGGNQYISEWVDRLDHDFDARGKPDPELAFKPGDKGVVGAQAEFLQTLTEGANNYVASVPPTQAFTAQFLVEWVNANHKRKRSDPWRSPFAGSTHWDGYVACKIELHPWGSGVTILPSSSAKLHCPKSDAVAGEMMRTLDPFHVGKAACPVHIAVTCTDRDRLPPFLRSAVPFTVQLDAERNVVGAGWLHEAWEGVLRETGFETHEILARFTRLSG
jgi:hypothetical protein